MNQVYLSGIIYDCPQLVSKPDAAPHLVFHLMVRHRSKSGIQKELYRINAWNACATYCHENLSQEMCIAIQGYLSQHQLFIEGRSVTAVEVTISEVFLPTRPAKQALDGAIESNAG